MVIYKQLSCRQARAVTNTKQNQYNKKIFHTVSLINKLLSRPGLDLDVKLDHTALVSGCIALVVNSNHIAISYQPSLMILVVFFGPLQAREGAEYNNRYATKLLP